MARARKQNTPETLKAEIDYIKKHLDKLWERSQDASERLQDIEVHVNLVTRLLTALCVEKFGMRIGVLKRMIRKIEKEAIQESQILHLENLYKLPHNPSQKPHHPKGHSEDQWEDIS